jgi:hypothetical protein
LASFLQEESFFSSKAFGPYSRSRFSASEEFNPIREGLGLGAECSGEGTLVSFGEDGTTGGSEGIDSTPLDGNGARNPEKETANHATSASGANFMHVAFIVSRGRS